MVVALRGIAELIGNERSGEMSAFALCEQCMPLLASLRGLYGLELVRKMPISIADLQARLANGARPWQAWQCVCVRFCLCCVAVSFCLHV